MLISVARSNQGLISFWEWQPSHRRSPVLEVLFSIFPLLVIQNQFPPLPLLDLTSFSVRLVKSTGSEIRGQAQ